ncbi:hypothetical protein GCM10010353_45840 [Streptomyces chryseus]|uniref:Uncharacterized protein n=1 Tax=Streptomyces chryseus TaxID=68186 RepID=A0ABQ3DL45_9ACTN|nr:hypothetical protein GCM10010353_45840 [Streptomyces chryseus]GHB05383.1 hypothetical protein GCM10010346_30500 [Streptomyces chryseus]
MPSGGGHHLASAGAEQLDHTVTENDGVLGQYHAQGLVDHDAIVRSDPTAAGECPSKGVVSASP